MGQEIERKFLVKDDSYKLEAYAHSHIVQGYICSARGRTVRVRIRDNKGYLTIKGLPMTPVQVVMSGRRRSVCKRPKS